YNQELCLTKVSSEKASTSTQVHEDEDDGTQSIIKSSRDLIFNDALISLESNDNKARMMALSGMGGVGKTTMMEQLVKAVDDRKTFNWIVKVAVGNNRNPVDIQETEDVCTQMDVETSLIYRIGVLKAEEAKKLFWDTARLGSNSDIEQLDLQHIGEEILKICGGLPLAIKTIASTLRDKEKFEWEDALSRLQNKNVDDYGIKEIFVISFENLKEDDLKAIFLLSGLFPEDSNIEKEDLLRMKKLEVVSYLNMHRPFLPQCLTNLRALCLRSCSLMHNKVSILGDLINLEVLDLAGCGINKLPSKIGQLRRLKLLDLSGCVNLHIDNGVFENLKQLEELYMGVCEASSVRLSDTNCDELKILSRQLFALELEFFNNKAQPVNVSFENLERFKISMGRSLEKRWRSDRSDGYYSFKNTLILKTSCSELRECKINELFRKTEILQLEVLIPKLEKLTITSMESLKEIWECEITTSEGEVNNIFMLREIEMSDCRSVVNLFPNNPMRLLTHLEELSVIKCGSIEVLFNIELGQIQQLSRCSLRNIKVWICESLREVWRIKGAEHNYFISDFQDVERIVIQECERFRNIVRPTTVNFDMKALKDIRIGSCDEYGERNNELCKNSQEQEINNISKERISKVDDSLSTAAFTSNHMASLFHQLRYIWFERVKGVKVVFEMESP
ncbi:hypothetical protein M8C21_002695, partial [Ambrosia artemisiifolia]